MPVMDGLEFIEQLRFEQKEIPVIITTAFDEIDYLKKALELKVEKYVSKPIIIRDLLNDIENLAQAILNKKELEKKKLQLENYKKAIHITSFVLEVDLKGDILSISNDLKNFFIENLEQNISINDFFELYKNFKSTLNSENLHKIMLERILNLDVFTKNIYFFINEKAFTFNFTAFASSILEDEIKEITIILKDLTLVVKDKDEIIHQLNTDPLTNLPNLTALKNELNINNEENYALCALSIDNYTKYKHTYGYEISDVIIKQLAQKLNIYAQSEEHTKLFKLENEIFAFLIKKTDNLTSENLKQFIEKIVNDIENFTFTYDDILIDTTITAGIAWEGKVDILLEALIALDFAHFNKRTTQFYRELKNPSDIYSTNILIQQKIKRALNNKGLISYFQPIVDCNKNLIKYESLCRIIDPLDNSKILTPDYFLDIVQDSKNYEKFTKIMIQNAIEGSLKLKAEVSINLSFEDIINPEIIKYLEEILKNEHPYPITLEFLESEGIQDFEATKNFCEIMKKYGAFIAIDDFGKGYSNFNYFLDVPFDILKIDGSLVKKVNDYKGYLLLKSIVDYTKKLGIKTVAEFVEDEEIFNQLNTIGIDMYQGYYIDKPKPLNEILK